MGSRIEELRKELDRLNQEELKIIIKKKSLENKLNNAVNKKFSRLVGTCYSDERGNAYYKIIEYSEKDRRFKARIFCTVNETMYLGVSIESIYYETIESLKPISESEYKSSLEKFKSKTIDILDNWKK